MPDKKLTDSEIKKALECCAITAKCRQECIFHKYGEEYDVQNCTTHLAQATLELVNRLQAEIERLREEKSKLENKIDEIYPLVMQLPNAMQQAKAKAIKEFAEKVSKLICDNTYPGFDKDGKAVNIWNAKDGYKQIDNLLKELVGDE